MKLAVVSHLTNVLRETFGAGSGNPQPCRGHCGVGSEADGNEYDGVCEQSYNTDINVT